MAAWPASPCCRWMWARTNCSSSAPDAIGARVETGVEGGCATLVIDVDAPVRTALCASQRSNQPRVVRNSQGLLPGGSGGAEATSTKVSTQRSISQVMQAPSARCEMCCRRRLRECECPRTGLQMTSPPRVTGPSPAASPAACTRFARVHAAGFDSKPLLCASTPPLSGSMCGLTSSQGRDALAQLPPPADACRRRLAAAAWAHSAAARRRTHRVQGWQHASSHGAGPAEQGTVSGSAHKWDGGGGARRRWAPLARQPARVRRGLSDSAAAAHLDFLQANAPLNAVQQSFSDGSWWVGAAPQQAAGRWRREASWGLRQRQAGSGRGTALLHRCIRSQCRLLEGAEVSREARHRLAGYPSARGLRRRRSSRLAIRFQRRRLLAVSSNVVKELASRGNICESSRQHACG